MLFRGLSAFPITPADRNGRVDVDELAGLLRRLGDAGVDSVGLLGSTGSYMYLTRSERRRAIEAAVDCLGGRTQVVASVGALRTDEAVALACDARAAGADGLLLAPVSYTPLNDEEVFQHFAAVSAAVDLPLCVYDNFGTTHFSFGLPLLKRLASLANVVAVKTSAPPADETQARHLALRSALPADFAIGYSADWNVPAAIQAGGDCWYSVVAGLLPVPALKLQRAAAAGHTAEVERINGHFEPLWALFRELSSYRVIHAAANILALSNAVLPRPMLPLQTADRARVATAIDALTSV